MMTITVNAADEYTLSFDPETRSDEVAQQLIILIRTIMGECPMYRDFGLNQNWLHMPQNFAETMFATSLIEGVQKYCPGLTVEHVDFDHDPLNPETLYPIVEVSFDE